MGAVISQKDNYAGNFGLALRSSAVFYYIASPQIKTTISFAHYWKFKNHLDVIVIASVRDMEGKLVKREQLSFADRQVINYRPLENFEGSVEIEALGLTNLRIPYAAIMAVYETAQTLSMVHSYARHYSPYEIEEGRTITQGEESCWTLRAESFAVIHNGGHEAPPQTIRMTLTREDGEVMSAQRPFDSLKPYQSLKLIPSEFFPDLKGWLQGQRANASVSFRLKDSFTRMLCVNHYADDSQWQVTHSNFNYTKHGTDMVQSDRPALMVIPDVPGAAEMQVLVYPDAHPGAYAYARGAEKAVTFASGQPVVIADVQAGQELRFWREDGALPSRIVTGLEIDAGLSLLAECSLGVVHSERPAKHFHWGVVGKPNESWLIITAFDAVYGEAYKGGVLTLRLYSASQQDYMGTQYIWDTSASVLTLNMDAVFKDAPTFLGGDFGYVSLWSPYGGFLCYTLLRHESGALALEHTF